jgi:hypothetical protein
MNDENVIMKDKLLVGSLET